METNKIIARHFKIVKPLFQINSYLYAQLCCLKNYKVVTAALYLYENEDPSQALKMLEQKLDLHAEQESLNIIFPYSHSKEPFNQKSLSVFFFKDYLVPLSHFQKKAFSTLQLLQILHGALSCLNQLHNREIIHGNISINTTYLLQNKTEPRCRFSLNILDTSYFAGSNCNFEVEELIFKSEGQSLGLNASYKDDLQSLTYVITHLLSKGKLFTVQRFQLEWVTEGEFLRWKTCDFFKQMVKVIPPQLEILIEIFTMAKTLSRNQIPDYLKMVKRVQESMIATRNAQQKLKDKTNQLITRNKNASKYQQLDENTIQIKFKKSNFSTCRHSKDENYQTRSKENN